MYTHDDDLFSLALGQLRHDQHETAANMQTTASKWAWLLWALLLIGLLNLVRFLWRTGSAIAQTFFIPGESVRGPSNHCSMPVL